MGIPLISEASVTDRLRKIVGSMPNKRLAQPATYVGLLDPDRRRTMPTDSESIVWEDACNGLGHFRRAPLRTITKGTRLCRALEPVGRARKVSVATGDSPSMQKLRRRKGETKWNAI